MYIHTSSASVFLQTLMKALSTSGNLSLSPVCILRKEALAGPVSNLLCTPVESVTVRCLLPVTIDAASAHHPQPPPPVFAAVS